MRPETVKVLALGPSDEGKRGELWANSSSRLRTILKKAPDATHVILAGDAWLSWHDVDDLAEVCTAQDVIRLEILSSGVPFSVHERVHTLLRAGIKRAMIHVPEKFFQSGSNPDHLQKSILGARALVQAGTKVSIYVPVNRYSRGYLDELAIAACWAGVERFEPLCEKDSLRGLAKMAKKRFESIKYGKFAGLPGILALFPKKEIKGISEDLCPWRSTGWQGKEHACSSVVLMEKNAPAILYCASDQNTLSWEEWAFVKNALGQVWKNGSKRPLRPARMCTNCLNKLMCPGIYSTGQVQEPADGEKWPDPPEAEEIFIDPISVLEVRSKMDKIGPGEKLLLRGRTSHIVLFPEKEICSEDSSPAASVDIQVAADLAASCGLVVKSYGLPWKTCHHDWWLCVQKPIQASHAPIRQGQSLLMVTNVCVTHCLMCGLPGMFQNSHAPAEQVLRHLVELRLLGMLRVDIFGGEVTLRPDLLFLARFARSRGLRSSFITTGYGLSPQMIDKIEESFVDQVEFALDADDEQTHNHIKGGLEVFRQATKLIARLSESNIMVDVNSVILKENMERLSGIVELVARLGADHLRFFPCLRFGIQQGRQLPLSLDDARKIWLQKVPAAQRRADELSQNLEVCAPCDPFDDLALREYSQGKPNSMPRHGKRCYAPDSEMSVLIDGSVIPCLNPSFYADLLQRPSNAAKSPLWKILSSEEMKALVDQAGVHPSCGACICYRDVPGAYHGTIRSLVSTSKK